MSCKDEDEGERCIGGCNELLSDSRHCKHLTPQYCYMCDPPEPNIHTEEQFHCILCNMEDCQFYFNGEMCGYELNAFDMITVYDLGYDDALKGIPSKWNNHIFKGARDYPGGIIYDNGYEYGILKKKLKKLKELKNQKLIKGAHKSKRNE